MLISKVAEKALNFKQFAKQNVAPVKQVLNNGKLGPVNPNYNPPVLNLNKYNPFKFYEVPQNNNKLQMENAKKHQNDFVKNLKKNYEMQELKNYDKKYYKELNNKITNKILITNILTILSFSSLVYLGISSEKKYPSIKNTPQSEKKIAEISFIRKLFNSIIEKIMSINIVLYNSLKVTFNILIKIPNISFQFIKLILVGISKIADINLYIKALNNFNIMCNNIIVTTSEGTKRVINNITTTINNFARLVTNTTGDIAIYNLNIFLRLLRLPTVNKQELLTKMKLYVDYLGLEIIIMKSKQLMGYKEIKEIPKSQLDIFQENISKLVKDSGEYFTENFNSTLKKLEETANKNYDSFINKISSLKNPVSQKLINKFNESSSEMKDYLYVEINNIMDKYKNNDDTIIKEYQYLINLP